MSRHDHGVLALTLGCGAAALSFGLCALALWLNRIKFCGRFDGPAGLMFAASLVLAMFAGLLMRGGFDLLRE